MANRFSRLRVIARLSTTPPRPRRPHPPAITATEPPAIFATAEERLSQPPGRSRGLPWAGGAAVLLHVLAIALALAVRERKLPPPAESPPGISVVFDNGGAPQAMAPPAQVHGPPQPAQTPATPPPPPPPQSQPPEVNLNVPLNALAALPPPTPRAQPRPAPRPQPRPAPPHYAMMLNGMSFGSPSALTPAPPAHRALNLDLAQTDAQAVMGPELTVKGDIGADWDAKLNRWVNEHKYYPQAAVEQQQQGSVEIEFTVDRRGHVTGLHMLNGSGSPFLDQAWLGLFQGAQLPPFPPGTTASQTTVDATMQYILEGP